MTDIEQGDKVTATRLIVQSMGDGFGVPSINITVAEPGEELDVLSINGNTLYLFNRRRNIEFYGTLGDVV